MDRIALGKQKNGWGHRTLLPLYRRLFRTSALETPYRAFALRRSAGRRVRACLSALWHLPDDYRWMEPLPYFHRRWVLIAAALLLIVLLWPYSPPQPVPRQPAEAPSQPSETPVMQAEAVQPSQNEEAPPPQTQWQSHRIVAGQTLAQLFRDNGLPVGDVFAMAQAEGDDRPLSNLRVGQDVRLQLNEQGVVVSLEVATANNRTARFVRQPDGTFIRAR